MKPIEIHLYKHLEPAYLHFVRPVLLYHGVELLIIIVSKHNFSTTDTSLINICTSSLQITFSVYDLWSTRRRAKKAFAWACKLVPLVLAGISIGLLQTKIVQRSFVVYMIVANAQCESI